jgi:hypothetical protein
VTDLSNVPKTSMLLAEMEGTWFSARGTDSGCNGECCGSEGNTTCSSAVGTVNPVCADIAGDECDSPIVDTGVSVPAEVTVGASASVKLVDGRRETDLGRSNADNLSRVRL